VYLQKSRLIFSEFVEREIVMNPSEESEFLEECWTSNGEDNNITVHIGEENERLLYQQSGEIISFVTGSKTTDETDMSLYPSLPFRCDLCSKSYDNEHDLRRHARCHSSDKYPLACQYCGKGFKTHSHKKEHER